MPQTVKSTAAQRATKLAERDGRKLGSRISGRQVEAVLAAAKGKRTPKTAFVAYATSADRDALTDKQRKQLKALVSAAQDKLPESQRRRLWPRKVAAIVASR